MKIKNITKLRNTPVFDISVEDAEHYFLENGVASHNTGGMYSANQVLIIGKSQEKDGAELSGFNFTINIEKSRFVREKSKFTFTVTFEGGINKWSGLMDMALELGFCAKPKQGWYAKVDTKTGEVEEKNYRLKDTNNKEFWQPILDSKEFKEAIHKRYGVSTGTLLKDEDIEKEFDDVEDENDE
jgi:hypothetical protein